MEREKMILDKGTAGSFPNTISKLAFQSENA